MNMWSWAWKQLVVYHPNVKINFISEGKNVIGCISLLLPPWYNTNPACFVSGQNGKKNQHWWNTNMIFERRYSSTPRCYNVKLLWKKTRKPMHQIVDSAGSPVFSDNHQCISTSSSYSVHDTITHHNSHKYHWHLHKLKSVNFYTNM